MKTEHVNISCDALYYGRIKMIAATQNEVVRIAKFFKMKKRDITISFHKDIVTKYFYVSLDRTAKFESKIERIRKEVMS